MAQPPRLWEMAVSSIATLSPTNRDGIVLKGCPVLWGYG